MVDIKRIERELRAANSDSDTSVVVRPVEDNLCHLKGVFIGPADTVYEGGEFVVDIQIPDEYPFRPPKVRGNAACFWIPPGADPVCLQMKFDTPIYHPNISSQTGEAFEAARLSAKQKQQS
nr:hypothetical protein HK105_000854 [Polyrhizophydium stewartii]